MFWGFRLRRLEDREKNREWLMKCFGMRLRCGFWVISGLRERGNEEMNVEGNDKPFD